MPRRRSPRRRSSPSVPSPTAAARALDGNVRTVARIVADIQASAGSSPGAVIGKYQSAKKALAEAEANYLRMRAAGADFPQFRSAVKDAARMVESVTSIVEASVYESERQSDAVSRERDYGFDLTRVGTRYADDDAYNANFEGLRRRRSHRR
jgi:hypothetical protein